MKTGSASSAKIGIADFSLQKRNAVKEISRSAEREGVQNGQARFAPSTAPPFEKGGRKLSPN